MDPNRFKAISVRQCFGDERPYAMVEWRDGTKFKGLISKPAAERIAVAVNRLTYYHHDIRVRPWLGGQSVGWIAEFPRQP